MFIEFDKIEESVMPHFQGGEKETFGRIFADDLNRIMKGRLEPGASIGMHTHEVNSEILYVLSGTATMLYDDGKEELASGSVHDCPKGHSHSLINTGSEPLIFLAVVPKQ